MSEEHARRRAALTARHGQPRSLGRPAETAAALRALGLRGRVHPRDAFAFAYRDAAAAAAWQQATLTHHDTPSLGTCAAEGGGVTGVYDLRPALAGIAQDAGRSWAYTDPALPDDWTPPRRPGGLVG